MEFIFSIFVLWVGYSIVAYLMSAGARTVRAAGKTALGQGGLAQNLQLEFRGIPPFETQVLTGKVGDGDGVMAIQIEGRGLFPVHSATSIGFITSVFDATDGGELKPMIALLEGFQEADSVVYQHVLEIGEASPNQGYVDWIRIGVALPEVIQPPRTGRRKIRVFTRMVDISNPPPVSNGFGPVSVTDHPGLLWVGVHDLEWNFELRGYEEESEARTEAQGVGIKIAVAVAMADGSFGDEEGETIRGWIVRSLAPFSGDTQQNMKNIFNTALREAYEQAEEGLLTLSALSDQMNFLDDRSAKYEAVELCLDVMASDGVAHPEELKLIRGVSDSLGLDYEEIERMRDQRIVGLDSVITDQADAEDLLGIEPDWDQARTLGHITTEYQKWSNRLNVLPEGAERENAQGMLDLLAEARTKYAKPGVN
jgi:tellurite resistance protein